MRVVRQLLNAADVDNTLDLGVLHGVHHSPRKGLHGQRWCRQRLGKRNGADDGVAENSARELQQTCQGQCDGALGRGHEARAEDDASELGRVGQQGRLGLALGGQVAVGDHGRGKCGGDENKGLDASLSCLIGNSQCYLVNIEEFDQKVI